MSPTRLVLATRNDHKVAELRPILASAFADAGAEFGAELGAELGAEFGAEFGLVGLDAFPDADEVVESGVTFEANALLKARSACAATGLIALADDSGLTVDVLGGAPGIFSARWSGRHGDDRANLELLLAQLGDVPDGHRGAGFICAAAMVTPDGREWVEHGRIRGVLTRAPRGDGGFGYDPVLELPDGRTLAQLGAEEKNAISHRSQAFRALAPSVLAALTSWAGGPLRPEGLSEKLPNGDAQTSRQGRS